MSDKSFWKRIKDWWEGDYIPYDNPPDSPVFVVGCYHEKLRTRIIWEGLRDYLRKNWQWITALASLVVAFAGAYIAYLQYLKS